MRANTAAATAKEYLSLAARNLGAANPLEDVSEVLEQSLAFPLHERYPHDPLAPNFTETAPENLSFMVGAGGRNVTPSDRIKSSTQAMSKIVSKNFGPQALRWFEDRVDGMKSGGYQRSASYGASFGSSFDRNGATESLVQYELGPMLMDSLPAPLFRIARTPLGSLP